MIGRFLKNKQLVTLIAGLICVVILMFFYNYRVNKIIDTIEIPVAVERLNARDEITSDKIKMIKVARSLLSNNVITSTQMLEGKYVNYNTFIPEGGMFYNSAVVEWETMPDSTWSDISDGKTIIYLDIEDSSSFGNRFFPGDRIDLYVRTDFNNRPVYGIFIKSIKILAVKDSYGNHIFEKSPTTGTPAQLIFEVDEDMFLLLKSALYTGEYDFVPVPRNSAYTEADGATEITSEELKLSIFSKVKILEPEVMDNAGSNADINVKE